MNLQPPAPEIEMAPDRVVMLPALPMAREYKHFGQCRRRRRNATVTTTRSGSKLTERTHTPGKHGRRQNAVETRMAKTSNSGTSNTREPTV